MRYILGLLLPLSINVFASTQPTPHETPLEVIRINNLHAHKSALRPIIPTPHIKKKLKVAQGSTFYPGSLKENITRVAAQFGWTTLIWKPNYDYQWSGTTQFTKQSLKELLQHVLHSLPLQAVFYQGNHVLVITTRNIQ